MAGRVTMVGNAIANHAPIPIPKHHCDSSFRKVGIALNGEWSEPLDPNDESHVEAAERNLQFTVGWFAHPIFKNGSYPPVMRERVCLVKN